MTEAIQAAATPAHGITRERVEAEVRARQTALQRLADAHVDEFNAFFVEALAEETPGEDVT